MTNFIYEREDYVERLKETVRKHEACNYDDYITLNELLDHIEAQGKQLRELNATITKKNSTIAKYEREKEDLQKRNRLLAKKVYELNNGIHDADDLSWKQKYDALRQGSEQAIASLQKKCQEYKHSEDDTTISAIETLSEANKKLEESNKRLMNRRGELMRQCDELFMDNEEIKKEYEDLEKNRDELLAERDALRNENNALKEEVNLYIGLCNTKHEEVEALAKAVRCPWGNNAEIISVKTARIKELEEENKKLKEDLEKKKQVSKDLNVIINSKNKLLDEYMTKANKLEKELAVWKTDDKRNFFGNTFDMHSIYDLNRLEEVIAHKIKSYDSRLYSLMAERDKYKESSEEYRLRLMVAERQCAEYKNFEKVNCDLRRRLSIIEDAIKK